MNLIELSSQRYLIFSWLIFMSLRKVYYHEGLRLKVYASRINSVTRRVNPTEASKNSGNYFEPFDKKENCLYFAFYFLYF